jgi:uncharacterized LabA/DUF88 family protein
VAGLGLRRETAPTVRSGLSSWGCSPQRGTARLSAINDGRSSTVAANVNNDRVIVYIDGYNLYHGLRAAKLHSSRWLDLRRLAANLLKPGQRLELVRYFTTRVRNDPGAAQRQAVYIDALHARGGIEIDFGHFLSKTVTCRSCRNSWQQNEEKKTDVNIAVRLLDDAYDDRVGVAIEMSGDSDLVPPVESIRARFPAKRLIVAFPPQRHSAELQRVADASFRISNRNIRASRLPDPVNTPAGIRLHAPRGWLPN